MLSLFTLKKTRFTFVLKLQAQDLKYWINAQHYYKGVFNTFLFAKTIQDLVQTMNYPIVQ